MADLQSRFDAKFLKDTAWNYAAFGIMAATGVILNFYIAAHFGIATLGVFNQIYAVYVIAAQVAVMGLHDSAQKHNAEFAADPELRVLVSATALILAFAFGLTTAAAMVALAGAIGRLADSSAVGDGIRLAAPGLLFFALNKVLMGILNGRRQMKAFAGAQGFRVVAILVVCLAVGAADLPGYMLGASFTIAEIALLPGLLIVVRPPLFGFGDGAGFRLWLGSHVRFGTKALANGFLAESYVRVDILMLGIFVSDAAVGIYSFAALFIEGLYQIPVVVRTIANPVLVELLIARDKPALGHFARKTSLLSLAAFAVAAGAVIVIYPYLAPFFPAPLVADSRPLLLILAAGLFLYSAFIPLDQALLQGGLPGRQSLLMTFNVLANVALNLALIPALGIVGAALATLLAYGISGLTVNLAAWRWLGIRGGLLIAR
jgi:O-antigen/teichoic acid export membrane protein